MNILIQWAKQHGTKSKTLEIKNKIVLQRNKMFNYWFKIFRKGEVKCQGTINRFKRWTYFNFIKTDNPKTLNTVILKIYAVHVNNFLSFHIAKTNIKGLINILQYLWHPKSYCLLILLFNLFLTSIESTTTKTSAYYILT